MMKSSIVTSLETKLRNGESNSPFLFVGENINGVNNTIRNIGFEILKNFHIPYNYIFILNDNEEKIKIQDIQDFAKLSYLKPPYPFQIFLIENISRFTIAASNSMLKLFEEPGNYNLIFLTNTGENGILDTILSRVQIVHIENTQIQEKNIFYTQLLENFIKNNNCEILNYFYKTKCEKKEYIDFLKTLILYGKENRLFNNKLEEIHSDLNTIQQNNVNPKYIVDKWLLSINI